MSQSPLQRPVEDPPLLLRPSAPAAAACWAMATTAQQHLFIVPVTSGVLRFVPPSSSSSPNMGGVGSWWILRSVSSGVLWQVHAQVAWWLWIVVCGATMGWVLVREVRFRFTSTCSTKRTKDRPAPPLILASSKRKERKVRVPRENLGMDHNQEYLRKCELEQSHELAKGDANQHCISERYSPGCGKMKKS